MSRPVAAPRSTRTSVDLDCAVACSVRDVARACDVTADPRERRDPCRAEGRGWTMACGCGRHAARHAHPHHAGPWPSPGQCRVPPSTRTPLDAILRSLLRLWRAERERSKLIIADVDWGTTVFRTVDVRSEIATDNGLPRYLIRYIL